MRLKSPRAQLIVLSHLYRLARTGQLRFRLETFGLYYPELPYQSAWWRFPARNALLLLRRAAAYARWVVEMEELSRSGAAGWWAQYAWKAEDDDLS